MAMSAAERTAYEIQAVAMEVRGWTAAVNLSVRQVEAKTGLTRLGPKYSGKTAFIRGELEMIAAVVEAPSVDAFFVAVLGPCVTYDEVVIMVSRGLAGNVSRAIVQGHREGLDLCDLACSLELRPEHLAHRIRCLNPWCVDELEQIAEWRGWTVEQVLHCGPGHDATSMSST